MMLVFSDAFRIVRSRALWAGAAVIALVSLYTALSVLAQAYGAPFPHFAMTAGSPEGGSETAASIPALTGAIGAAALGGSLLPLVASIVVVLIASEGAQGGFDKCLLSSGVSRISLLREQFVISVLVGASMLAAAALPFAVLYALLPSPPVEPASVAEVAWWCGLVVFHTALYAFVAGLTVLLTRRRLVGLLCAFLVSLGMVEMALVALVEGLSGATWLAELLPRSVAEALSTGAGALHAPYLGSVPLFAVALAAYVVITVAVGFLAVVAYRKRSLV